VSNIGVSESRLNTLNVKVEGRNGGKLMYKLVHYRNRPTGILYLIKPRPLAKINPFSVAVDKSR
jgi:hypothetical protein